MCVMNIKLIYIYIYIYLYIYINTWVIYNDLTVLPHQK